MPAPKMAVMSTRNTYTMLTAIHNGPNRLEPPAPTRETADTWTYEDCSWHSSSFELARGLEVIEYRGPYPAAFADVWPAFRPARA
jgi:hypothetical protein